MMNRFLSVLLVLACAASAQPDLSPERLAGYLKQFPDADTNKDSLLSLEEARAYYTKLRGKSAKPVATGEAPTFADVHYGPHERNVLDFWQAKTDAPTPLVVFIHGGGFTSGDKSKVRGDALVKQCLDAGVSFAAINYRYRTTTPLQDVLRDCARAVQFLRSKSGEWHLDKVRIASYGGSAGAGTSLWLAFHDDLADPNSSDPVLRESSRIVCAGALSTQFSYDVVAWEKLFGPDMKKYMKPEDGPVMYGLKTEEEMRGPAGEKVRADCDMCGLMAKGAPPVFVSNSMPTGDIKDRGHLLHHPKHAEAIKQRGDELGLVVVASIPGLGIKPGVDQPQDLRAFLFKYLGVTAPKS